MSILLAITKGPTDKGAMKMEKYTRSCGQKIREDCYTLGYQPES